MKTYLISVITVLAVALVVGSGSARADVEDDVKDGDKAYEEEDWKRAASAYDRAIKAFPKQVPPGAYAKRASIYLILSSVASAAGNKDLARKHLSDGLQFITQRAEPTHPDSPVVLEQKALLLWALKSKPDAVEVAEKVVDKKPDAFGAQKILGEFYAVRKPNKAIDALSAYLKHRPENLERQDVIPRIHLGFAYLSVAQGKRRTDAAAAKELATQAKEQFEVLRQRHSQRPHAEVNANNGLCAAYTFLGEYNRAITVCEKIIQNPRNIDRAGSVFYNLGQSYLENRQPAKARTVGKEYIRLRKSEAKGYILVGDAFAQERNWTAALEQYQKAEEYAKNNSEYAADIGIKLGMSYRRTDNLDLAIAKLESALEVDPNNTDLIRELGNAYIEAGRDDDALARAEAAIEGEQFGELEKSQQVDLLVLAGRAAYNLANTQKKGGKGFQQEPAKARQFFAAAYDLDKKDVKVSIGLIRTINLQSYRAYEANDVKKAEAYLREAYDINSGAPLTNQNVAVMYISRGDCDEARRFLAKLSKQRSYQLMYHRLSARTWLCGKQKSKKRAVEHFAQAEKAAGNVNLVRAEIYTEWAPLIWDEGDKELDRAIDMLESAVQYTAQNRTLATSAQRNLALALFRRGWRTMRGGGNKSQAAEDFERAARDPSLLKGSELAAFEFSEALAQLDRGNTQRASKLFASVAKSGKQNEILKDPYDKFGGEFFEAYADYRTGSRGALNRAAGKFRKMLGPAKGKFAGTVRELLAGTYHELAYKDRPRAKRHLADADRYASGNAKREIAHNQAVVNMGRRYNAGIARTFDRMNANPPEALANYGIMLDRQGKAREAYEAWVKARARGVRDKDLNDWINAKKRIFGF